MCIDCKYYSEPQSDNCQACQTEPNYPGFVGTPNIGPAEQAENKMALEVMGL